MVHRLSSSVASSCVAGFALLVLATAVTSTCSSDPPPSSCVLVSSQSTEAAPTRLDAVGDGLVMLSAEADKVRWAHLGRDLVLDPSHEIDVPPHVGAPWFGVAGLDAAMDSLVVAYVPAGSSAVGMVDLMTFTVRFNGTMPTLPVGAGQIPADASVVMASGRMGRNAAIAWGVPGATTITARILGGDGLPIRSDLTVGDVENFSCLGFSAGKGDLTLGYVDLSGTPPAPTFVGAEIDAAGLTQQPVFRVGIGKQVTGCAQLAPNDTGYGLTWHITGVGTYLGQFTPGRLEFPSFQVLSDVRVSGTVPEPVGIGWMGKDYALLFVRPTGAAAGQIDFAEVWPVDASGHRKGTVSGLPGSAGNIADVSSQALGTDLYISYLNRTVPPGSSAAGVRYLVKISCPVTASAPNQP